jgi:hypothetical protein
LALSDQAFLIINSKDWGQPQTPGYLTREEAHKALTSPF